MLMYLCLEKVNFPSYIVYTTNSKEGETIFFPYVKTLPNMSYSECFSERYTGLFSYSTKI